MPQFPQYQTALRSGQLGAVQPFLSSYNPSRRLNTGVTCAWSQHWWMLGSNHGNRQVSVSLPLPVTLRCHHVLVTSQAPHVPSTQLPLSVPKPPQHVWQRDAVAAGLCRGSPSPPRRKGQIQASNTTQAVLGLPGLPSPPGTAPSAVGWRKEPRAAPPPHPRRWQHPCPAAPAEGAPRGAQSNICKRLTTQPARPFPK